MAKKRETKPSNTTQAAPRRSPGGPDKALRGLFAESVRLGMDLPHACDVLGVNRRTFRDWVQKGNKDLAAARSHTTHAKLVAEIQVAKAGVERDMLVRLHQAAAGEPKTKVVRKNVIVDGKVVDGLYEETTETTCAPDWRAAAWMLEKLKPERYGKKVDVTSKGGRLGQTHADHMGAVAGANPAKDPPPTTKGGAS